MISLFSRNTNRCRLRRLGPRGCRRYFVVFALLALGGLSAAIDSRAASSGHPASESDQRASVPLGLPPLPDWAKAITPEQIALGQKLFFDRGLSFNNTLSCSMCHLPEDGFASTQSTRSVGMEGRTLQRNAPSLLNVVFQESLFHDGREESLALQAWLPLLHPDEMANPSMGHVLSRVKRDTEYVRLFAAAFPGRDVNPVTLGDALAAYQATLLSGASRFDRWKFGGEEDALSEAEKRGFELFTGKANCARCHKLENDHALFTDSLFHNTGIGYRAVTQKSESYKVELAPGVVVDVASRYVDVISGPVPNDIGRFAVTLDERDRWAYRTATLRSVSRTAPYMHDGSIATLGRVIEYYNDGGFRDDPALDPLIERLGLTETERADLEAFLRALDGAGEKQPLNE